MNATIKAAHAGEAGKDFAVVADEIRKLAESSSEQSKTINDVLKKIKDSIDKITASTAEVLQNFEAISQSVKSVTDQEANVRSAMEEQGMGNKTILNSIGNLNGITGDLLGKPISGLLGKYVSGLSGKPISGLLGKYVSVQTGSMDYSPLGCRLDPKGKLNSLLDILSNTLYT